MTNSRPSRRQLQQFAQAAQAAANAPTITPRYLAELAAKRDAYLATLK